MCLIIPEKKKIKNLVKIAKKDIKVYKSVDFNVVTSTVVSSFYGFEYVKNTLYKKRIGYDKNPRFFSSWDKEEMRNSLSISYTEFAVKELPCTFIGAGFHSMKFYFDPNRGINANAIFIIPKGAQYIEYLDMFVSNRIIFKNLI